MRLNPKIYEQGLVQFMMSQNAGKLVPVVFDLDYTKGITLMNPSIYNDGDKYLVNVRCVNYILHHSEKNQLPHWDGPLQYIHPETDVRLGTENYICEYDTDLNLTNKTFVDMALNVKPNWGFTGLEDARIFRWMNKLYLCGVRRDVKDNGEGRMELSEIKYDGKTAVEVSRHRIPSSEKDDEYCVKNMGAIIDIPYNFVKWYSPTEIQVYDIESGKVVSGKTNRYNTKIDVRGGSQVIPWKDYRICIGHSVRLWKPYSGTKDSCYQAHLIVWDKNFNLLYISDEFKFLNAQIEFNCGLCKSIADDDLIVSFAYMDNAAYLFKFNPELLFEV